MTSELNPVQPERIARRSGLVPTFTEAALAGTLGSLRFSDFGVLGRMAEVADIAAPVAFLLCEAARNFTGTVLTVAAGETAWGPFHSGGVWKA